MADYAITTDFKQQLMNVIKQHPSVNVQRILEQMVDIIKTEFDKVDTAVSA
jgi:hypothetical protein